MEGKKLGMKRLWVYVIASLTVGVSLALPLFLFMRERRRAGEFNLVLLLHHHIKA
ncbi:DUF2834 domain-containing protein [Paenibacillus elgii]|uniref:DUF2834 domain-containing protein n=1 Tax=Paenibacillus elgii TaxID=189691 RepID=UPI002351D64F|nr:DUF2834 domain-containing protein [Paenibacillus elgii]